MSDTIPVAQLRAFVERIERLEEEKRTIADDIKEVKAEAKGCGLDLPTINAILKIRKKDQAERDEEQAMLDLYMSALGMMPLFESEAVPSYSQSGLSYADEKGRGDHHVQPVGTLEASAKSAQDDVGATASSTYSHSQAIPSKPADTAEEVTPSSRASSATHSDDIDLTIPAFLKRDEGRGYPKRESVEA